MNVPLLDLKAQYQAIKEEINRKINEVIESQSFILGSEVQNFEKEMAEYSSAKYAVGVSSGSDALICSLMMLQIGPGDEVITTPFTFFATAGAVARLGAKPIFCDIERETYNMDPEKLKEVIESRGENKSSSKMKAVIPIHLYGQCVDMDPVLEVIKNHNIFIIEDGAQAVGAEYPSAKGVKKACTMGDVGILSFFPSKNLGGYGDGGMILTNNQELFHKLKLLRVHGAQNKYFHDLIGGNFRLDSIQAAILRVKLQYLEDWHQKRRENAQYYCQIFKDLGLAENGWVHTPVASYSDKGVKNYHIYNQFVIRVKKRDELQKYLKEKGIGTAIYYPVPLHLQKCFEYLGYKKGAFPVSEKASTEVLALPVYPELSKKQQDYIGSCISSFYK
ncbi:MAG: DegT/DnrJ/EryC1/StrS family aminotransferase [Candidatus Aminicenantaceae bacterium]